MSLFAYLLIMAGLLLPYTRQIQISRVKSTSALYFGRGGASTNQETRWEGMNQSRYSEGGNEPINENGGE